MSMPFRAVLTATALVTLASAALSATLLDEKFPRRNRLEVIGFDLLKPGEIEISATGLGYPDADNMIAYGWIIDQDTRHVVWEMKSDETEKAWGKKYVRKTTTEKVFARGKYELYIFTGNGDLGSIFVSDDHGAFKALSRIFSGSLNDPEDYLEDCFIRLNSTELTPADLKKFDPAGDIPGALIAETRLGNDEYIEKGFKLDKPMNLRVYAFMEQLPGSDPVDFGWITNAETRTRVWTAAEERSLRAGGNKKNRKIDAEISLPAGNYVLSYVTDDSHSYRRFNAAPPYDPMNWGITLLPGKEFVPSAFHLSTVPAEPKPLIDMTEIGDDEDISTQFALTRPMSIRVRALGEQSSLDDDFADYGWIEDAGSGKTVWEMTSRNTEHAGGAGKNRIFDGELSLPAGKYVVRYVSDDSHSYPDWNSGQPWNPRAWGIAIFPEKGFTSGDFKTLTESTQRHRSHRSSRSEHD
ncbi:MAG: hypothetical protein HY851_01945 [candidate division Zixibacteria bacterium]|nr:hypothetical protein [candidate division Zixibacteria bacterium]